METKLQTRRSVWKGAQQIPNTTTSTTAGRRGAGVRQGSPLQGPPVPGQALPHFSFSHSKEHPKKHGIEERGEEKREGPPSAFLICHGVAGGLDRVSLPPSPARAAPRAAVPCVPAPHRQRDGCAAVLWSCSRAGGHPCMHPASGQPPTFASKVQGATAICALSWCSSLGFFLYNPSLLMERKGGDI